MDTQGAGGTKGTKGAGEGPVGGPRPFGRTTSGTGPAAVWLLWKGVPSPLPPSHTVTLPRCQVWALAGRAAVCSRGCPYGAGLVLKL